MIYQVIQFVAQGGLPSPAQLHELKTQGFKHLLNLSGIDLFKLYPPEILADFTLAQFRFTDIFSTGAVITLENIANIDTTLYTAQSSATEQLQFFNAVQQLIECLKTKQLTYVFCQQGIGRSPCVLCAALNYAYHPSYGELLKTIRFLNPHAVVSTTSYAAVKWFEQQASSKS